MFTVAPSTEPTVAGTRSFLTSSSAAIDSSSVPVPFVGIWTLATVPSSLTFTSVPSSSVFGGLRLATELVDPGRRPRPDATSSASTTTATAFVSEGNASV